MQGTTRRRVFRAPRWRVISSPSRLLRFANRQTGAGTEREGILTAARRRLQRLIGDVEAEDFFFHNEGSFTHSFGSFLSPAAPADSRQEAGEETRITPPSQRHKLIIRCMQAKVNPNKPLHSSQNPSIQYCGKEVMVKVCGDEPRPGRTAKRLRKIARRPSISLARPPNSRIGTAWRRRLPPPPI